MARVLGDVRPEERRGAWGAFLTLALIMVSHALLETGRDALFLETLPTTYLPWVYLTIAVIALTWTAYRRRSSSENYRRYQLAIFLGFAAVFTSVLWVLAQWKGTRPLLLLYVWTGLYATVSILQFWLALSATYTVTQAKRLFGFIGAGGLLGAIVGSGIARLITGFLPTRHVLFASALAMAASAFASAWLSRKSDAPTERESLADLESEFAQGGHGLLDDASLVRGHPYLFRVAVLVLVSTVALTITDYVFKTEVARSIPDEQLGTFFSTLYVVLNVLGLVVQVSVVSWLLHHIGVNRSLWILPLALIVGGAWAGLGGGLAAVLLMKGADGSLRYSLHRTGTEVLYVPVVDPIRTRAKAFIDVVGQRGGQALGSLLILGALVLKQETLVLSILIVLLGLIWVIYAGDLKKYYLDLFRRTLEHDGVASRVSMPPLDQGSLEALFAALNSDRNAEVLAAIDVLAERGKVALIPALILHHPSRVVVLRAIEHFVAGKRIDFVPVAGTLLSHEDPELRAAVLRAISTVEADESVLRGALEDESPLVRATALVHLMSRGWFEGQHAQEALDAILDDDNAETRRALAAAIHVEPSPIFEIALLRLLDDPDVSVRREAVRAMVKVRSARFLPALLPLVTQRELRSEVRQGFAAMGPIALSFLRTALSDTELPRDIRLHVPRSLGYFPPRQAAPILLAHLLDEPDGAVRFKILRGLGSLRRRDKKLPLDKRVLRTAAKRSLVGAYQLLDYRRALRSGVFENMERDTPASGVLRTLLEDKERHAIERVLRILALLHAEEDFKKIHRGLRSENPKARASSRELLLHTVEAPLREPLLGMLDDVSEEERVLRGEPVYTAEELTYEEALARVIGCGSESLATIAAYHAGELGLHRLRSALESMRTSKSEHVAAVIERALKLLDKPLGLVRVHA